MTISTITRKRRHEAMIEQGMHSGNTDAKFDPPPDPRTGEKTPLALTSHNTQGEP